MSFSLDLSKPLGRLGLVINTVLLTAIFYGVSVGSYHYMSHTLPESSAHAQEAAAKAALVDKAVAKAKTAAKGKAFDAAAAKAQAEAAVAADFKKQAEEIHHHAVEGWAPFAVFLLVLSAVFFAGFHVGLRPTPRQRRRPQGPVDLHQPPRRLGVRGLRRFLPLPCRPTVSVMPGPRL